MLNKIELIGRLGADPEIRHTSMGDMIASLRVATSRQYKNKLGEKIEDTQWHRVTLFGQRAKFASEFTKKGSLVYLEGRMTYNRYLDKNGVERTSADVVAHNFTLLDGWKQRDAEPPEEALSEPVDVDDEIPF